MSDFEDDDDTANFTRSRKTQWRHKGSKRQRLQESSDSSDFALTPEAPAPGPSTARNAENIGDGSSQLVGLCASLDEVRNAQDRTFSSDFSLTLDSDKSQGSQINLDASFDVNEVDPADTSDVDSNWSYDLNLDYGEECVEDDKDDYDPFIECDQEYLIQQVIPDHLVEAEVTSDEEDQANYTFAHDSTRNVLRFSQERTVKDSLLLDLAMSLRFKLTYEWLIQNQKMKNFLLGFEYFPVSKKPLFRALGRNDVGMTFYVYCSSCGYFIGNKRHLPDLITCNSCNSTISKVKAKYFVELSLRKQLAAFLSLPGVADLLQYRENRRKRLDGAIEDIYDSVEYRKIEVDGNKLSGSNNFSYVFNTDGCKIRKGAKTTIYPLYVRINELPPQLRQKFMFLAGVYVDNVEPNMQSLLRPFVRQMRRLAEEGVKWKKNNQEVVSKFLPTCFCVDGKARAQILNMVSHNGYHSCSYYTYYGIHVANTMRYPFHHEDLPPIEARTRADVHADMKAAADSGITVRGFKGLSPLASVDFLDLVKGAAVDDLHYLYLCASLQHTELLLTAVPHEDGNMGKEEILNIIDIRMKSIKTPSCIARKPGTCQMKNRKQMHASEWRNWLIYCAPICLRDLLPKKYLHHLELLSHASYLLSQDIITEGHIETARKYITEYLKLYDEYFGIENTRLNLHSLIHMPDSVQSWGGLWCYSTFNFESWNHKLMQNVTSAKGALHQIVSRHLLYTSLNTAMHVDEEIDESLKVQLRSIMLKERHANAQDLGNHVYALGTPTHRGPSAQEYEVLQREGFGHCQELQIFKKVLVRGTTYSVAEGNRPNSYSDNTSVYTHEDTFGTIQKIVAIPEEDGNLICGIFLLEHDVVQRQRPLFKHAKHIVEVRLDTDILHFIKAEEIRCPVVKARVLGDCFFIPVSNLCEID